MEISKLTFISLFFSPGVNVHYVRGFTDRAEPWSSLKEVEMLFIHNAKDNTVASISVIFLFVLFNFINNANNMTLHIIR